MATICGKSFSCGKIVFEKSHLRHSKSQHLKAINEHWFNAAVDITIPDSTSLVALGIVDGLHETCERERFSYIQSLPVACLVRAEFIEAFVKKGNVYLLSQGTSIDGDDCICLLPSGQLILNLKKTTYEGLGIEGKASAYNGKKVKKFGNESFISNYMDVHMRTSEILVGGHRWQTEVVTIDLLASYFKPGRKGYERIQKCLSLWNAKFDCHVLWKPTDTSICPSSLPAYLSQTDSECRAEKRSHKHSELNFQNSRLPIIQSDDPTGDQDDHVAWDEFYDWLGCRACGISDEGKAGNFVNRYSTPEPNKVSSLTVHRYSGFLSCEIITQLMQHLRNQLPSCRLPWLSLTIHGFDNSPVTWRTKEHGYFKSGDNFQTFVLFPDESYWLIKTVGPYDVCP